jgi:hypothetical protein
MLNDQRVLLSTPRRGQHDRTVGERRRFDEIGQMLE